MPTFWVMVQESKPLIFFGLHSEVIKAPGVSEVYGPFNFRREAKGCVSDLESGDPELKKGLEKKLSFTAPAGEESPASESNDITETSDTAGPDVPAKKAKSPKKAK